MGLRFEALPSTIYYWFEGHLDYPGFEVGCRYHSGNAVSGEGSYLMIIQPARSPVLGRKFA